ncbi:MAG: formylglycine-generating enzyme family protein [Methylococcaceae bacterium]|jgi:formylglycine-generating enzyme required for sulfatase activity
MFKLIQSVLLFLLLECLSLPSNALNDTANGQSNATSIDTENKMLELENKLMRRELNALKRKQRIANQKPKEQKPLPIKPATDQIEMVKLPNGLQVGKYEVTQAQWQSVTGNNPAKFNACGETCPVEQISWDEVQSFIQQLNAKTNKHYRLPTEEEWQTACLAGVPENEYCGANAVNLVAWSKDNTNATPNPVGKKQPNAWGLYDMSGNVWEWTSTCDGQNCSMRIVRGGSWFNSDTYTRASSRDSSPANHRFDDIGFRLVLEH